MPAPHSNPKLFTLAPELLLTVISNLPSFPDLLAVILAHRSFNTIWKANEFTVCGGIARNHFGPLWDDAYALLVAQGALSHHNILDRHTLFNECPPESGNGVLDGGTKIGLREIFQMVPQYHQQLRSWREVHIQNIPDHYRRLFDNHRNVCTIGMTALPISPDEEFLIDRALLRYWLLLVRGAPEVVAYNDGQRWSLKHNGGILNATQTMGYGDFSEAAARRFSAVEPYLASFGEEELQQLSHIATCSKAALPFPGGAGIWGDRYFDDWTMVAKEMSQLRRWTGLHIKRAVLTCRTREKRARRRDVYNAFVEFCVMSGL